MTAGKGKKGTAKALGNYTVGFGKPPKNHQFPKGKSGNPSGRPKGSVPLHDRFLKEAERLVKIKTNGGKTQKVPKIDVVIRRLLEGAMQGKPDSQRLLLAYLLNAQVAQQAEADDGPALSDAAAKTLQMMLAAGLLK